MKEYNVKFLKQSMTPKSHTEKLTSLLNQMAEQGWDYKSTTSPIYYIFEREK